MDADPHGEGAILGGVLDGPGADLGQGRADEGRIRTGFLNDDLIEAVIGLGPQLFYGTGIPACILLLRPIGSKPTERQGKVLFINADRDYREGRAQNYLEPEHIEKIVSAYRSFEDIPGFARVISRAELAENDDNLNIRRYVDTTPEPEPQDVRAHLHGGIPKSEVSVKAVLFSDHGLDPDHLFVSRDDDYLQFADAVTDRRNLLPLIDADAGVMAAEAAVVRAIEQWWTAEEARFDKLQSAGDLVKLRQELIETFRIALAETPLLDSFAVRGVIASWWGANLPDLKALATLGYQGLIDAWVTTVLDALEEEKATVSPLDHKVALALLPEYLDQLSTLEAKVVELESTIKAATASDDDESAEPADDSLSPEAVKGLKSKLAGTKKQLKAEKAEFAHRLDGAGNALNSSSARRIVLNAMELELLAEAQDRIARHREALTAAFETWWDKYQTPLSTIERKRDEAAAKLTGFLKELGYE